MKKESIHQQKNSCPVALGRTQEDTAKTLAVKTKTHCHGGTDKKKKKIITTVNNNKHLW